MKDTNLYSDEFREDETWTAKKQSIEFRLRRLGMTCRYMRQRQLVVALIFWHKRQVHVVGMGILAERSSAIPDACFFHGFHTQIILAV